MKRSDIISAAYAILTKWSKSRLLRTIEILRDGYREQPFQGSTSISFSPRVFSRLRRVVCLSWQPSLAEAFWGHGGAFDTLIILLFLRGFLMSLPVRWAAFREIQASHCCRLRSSFVMVICFRTVINRSFAKRIPIFRSWSVIFI
jgi:hypothetical protein